MVMTKLLERDTSLGIDQYAQHTGTHKLENWFNQLQDHARTEYLRHSDWIDIIAQFPPKSLTVDSFVACLATLAPRLYSISSSQLVDDRSIHLTVSAVRYESMDRKRKGVCSTYLTDRVALGEKVIASVRPNRNFRLPQDPTTAIIMIGPGCGVAPFRAFMQARSRCKTKGKSWLLFGDQHRNTDFLYEAEWNMHLKNQDLIHIDLAFSRDTERKTYVQDRLREHGKRLYEWLEDGAYLYVCGDGANMARDIDTTIANIITTEGGCSMDAARIYIKRLQKDRRYYFDVY